MPRNKDGLTPKQERFVAEYLIDLNATQAAIRAGYSENGAKVTASKLLAVANVAAAVQAGKESLSVRTGITQERTLDELEGMAFARWDHFDVDAAGNVTAKPDAPANVMAAIQGVKRKEWSDGSGGHTVDVEIKLAGKFEPLKLAGRHVGIFADRVEVTGKGGKDLMPTIADAMAALMNAAPKKA